MTSPVIWIVRLVWTSCSHQANLWVSVLVSYLHNAGNSDRNPELNLMCLRVSFSQHFGWVLILREFSQFLWSEFRVLSKFSVLSEFVSKTQRTRKGFVFWALHASLCVSFDFARVFTVLLVRVLSSFPIRVCNIISTTGNLDRNPKLGLMCFELQGFVCSTLCVIWVGFHSSRSHE